MDATFWWILGGGLAMSAIAGVGGLAAGLSETAFQRITLPLVALSAGSLLGGALFHMLPAAVEESDGGLEVWGWTAIGFLLFFVLEQILQWHHCHRPPGQHVRPLGWLLLLADGLHNFLGGLAVAGAFLADIRLGVATWLAAAAHEVPQELGDFGVLVHSGWSRTRALTYNVLSALPFLLAGLLAWRLSRVVDLSPLLPLAAGNFLYIAAVDLVPEVNRHPSLAVSAVHLAAFSSGLALLLGLHLAFHP